MLTRPRLYVPPEVYWAEAIRTGTIITKEKSPALWLALYSVSSLS